MRIVIRASVAGPFAGVGAQTAARVRKIGLKLNAGCAGDAGDRRFDRCVRATPASTLRGRRAATVFLPLVRALGRVHLHRTRRGRSRERGAARGV